MNDNDKPDLFIITSAISTKVGSIDINTRFLQTIATIHSIIVNNPKSVILIADGSLENLPSYMITELNRRAIFVSHANDLNILNIHKQSVGYSEKCTSQYSLPKKSKHNTMLHFGAGYIKNASESYLLLNILNKINAPDFNRIFKISGRYLLGSEFDRAQHVGKITTKKAAPTNQIFELVETDRMVNCVLWSFDPSCIEEIKDWLRKISEWIDYSNSIGKPGPDIEHGIYKFFKDRTEIENIGIIGVVNVPDSIPKFGKA